MHSIQTQRRGTVLVLAAVCLMMIFAFVAFTVDIGYIALVKTQLQNAADASALAGAQGLRNSPDEAKLAAKAVALENEAAREPVYLAEEDVELGKWNDETATFIPLVGAAQEDADAVRVTCRLSKERGNALSLFFAPVLGIFKTDISTPAVARLRADRCATIFGIEQVRIQGSILTDSYNSSLGTYSQTRRDRGHVCSNGQIALGGASRIHGDAHPGPGQTVSRGGAARVTGETKPLQNEIDFPPVDPGDAATFNNNGSIGVTDRGNTPLNENGDFSIGGSDSITLEQGTYYFNSMSIGGNATISITGPTEIYIVDNVNLTGSGLVNPAQIPSDLRLYVMGSNFSLTGSGDWYGVIYAPDARVSLTGAADIYGMVVGREIAMTGGRNGGIHADESLLDYPEFDFLPRRAVLVQ